MISAHDVQHAAFGRAKEGKSGYDEVAVDDFLDRAVATIEAIEQGKPAPAGALTSHDVVEAVFAEKDANTDGGYDLDDVDDLLDRVAQRLFEHEKQENQQNRAGHTSTASSGPAAPAADDPGELVDNDRADQDRVYTRDELRQTSGEPATASAQASDAGHGVAAGGTRTTVVAGAGLGAGAVAAEGVAQRDANCDAAADTTPTDGSTGQDSTTGGRETTLSGINPAGGEAVDQHAASSADRDEVDRRNREEKVSDGVASETATSASVAGEAKRDGVGEAAPVAQTSQAPTFGEAAAANSASESGVSGGETAQTVEQYPATDHRVPLPRGDMGAQLSDEDLRAQQNYHPEFSEYDAASAQRRADSEAAAPAESEDRTAARGADEAVAQVYNENDTTDHETPVSTGKSESESSVSSEPVVVANPTEQGKPVAGAPQVVSTQTVSVDKSEGQSLPATDVASTGTQDTTTAAQTSQTSAAQTSQGGTTENVTATDNKADSVARPERIDRPEPIDRPQELPKREDKSRKGLLRRIFRG